MNVLGLKINKRALSALSVSKMSDKRESYKVKVERNQQESPSKNPKPKYKSNRNDISLGKEILKLRKELV
jgi:hypothetical protein